MEKFKEVTPEEFNQGPFKLIGKDWMLVTAEKDGKANTMTASWGGLGVMWHKNVAFVVLRPQRYTKTFVDSSNSLSLTFFDDSHKKTLSYLGSVSGRDEDKIAKSNLTLAYSEGVPYFEEAKIAIICKNLYTQDFKPELFLDGELEKKVYPNKDYHTLYITEVEKILVAGGIY